MISLQLVFLRSCGSEAELEAGSGMPHVLRRGRPTLRVQLLYFSRQPHIPPRSRPCEFLASAFCKVQLILRRLRMRSWRRGAGFRCQPHIAHRSPPCKFLGGCSCEGAIDFAELRWRSGVGGVANGGAECRTFFGISEFAPDP